MMLFEPLLIALSTYSSVPVPQFEWNERNMKYAICFFPVVGVLCGAVLAGWYLLARYLGVSQLLFASVATCIPLLLTGGIHMDGYMDTVDALASHRPWECKLEIMKDPHCGAFAVIYCGVYLLLQVGLLYELYERQLILVVCPAFVLSRILSALCAVTMPNARKGGMLCAYTKDAEKRIAISVLIFLLLLICGGELLLFSMVGSIVIVLSLVTVLFYRWMAMDRFGGVTGDTSGFFLQTCELVCLFAAWLGGMLV